MVGNILVIFSIICIMYTYTNRFDREGFYENDIIYNIIFVSMIFLMFLLTSLRGDFTIDYINNTYIFNAMSNMSLKDVIINSKNIHAGVVYRLIIFCSQQISYDYNFIFGSFALFEFILVGLSFKRNSKISWLSIVLFISTGLFSAGFNITRQILSVSVMMYGMYYLNKGKKWKYLLAVLVAFLTQETAVIMLIYFFVTKMNWTRKKIIYAILLTIIVSLIVYIFPYQISYFGAKIMGKEYSLAGYGLTEGLSITSLILPSITSLIVFIFRDNINYASKEDINYLIALFAYILFSIASLKIELMIRFSYFFLAYNCFFIPNLLARNKYNRKLKILIVASIFIIYFFLSSNSELNYYFYWQ